MSIIGFDYISEHSDFNFALGAFLDEFRRAKNKSVMISTPPPTEGLTMRQRCILAAVAHKLANDNVLEVPTWVHEPDFKMPNPVFAFDTKNKGYQAFLLQDTPYEFASKNIYHGANSINRV